VISRGFHRGFTAAEKTELWDRWQRGESLKAIGRAFSKPSSSIYFQPAPHGGIRPAARRRSRLALTLSEEISRGIAAAQSARSMARLLGRCEVHKLTLSAVTLTTVSAKQFFADRPPASTELLCCAAETDPEAASLLLVHPRSADGAILLVHPLG
jgi:hypothetical protein